mgnify:CR=1 FL=1
MRACAELQGGKMKQQVVAKPRDGFTTGLGVIAATLGSAIGLGNIWKFPSLTGTNGGAAFLLLYLACTLLVGLPVMISELALGRRARANAVSTFQNLAPREPWWLVGAAGALAAFLMPKSRHAPSCRPPYRVRTWPSIHPCNASFPISAD